MTVPSHVLDNGICLTCDNEEDRSAHIFDDGQCLTCEQADALIVALDELSSGAAAERAFDPAKHPRNPKGSPGGGRFRSMVDRLKDAIAEHLHSNREGHPFAEFDREQLRRVAKARGIVLQRGEDRDSIAQKLLDHLRPTSGTSGKTARPVKAAAMAKLTGPTSVRAAGNDVTNWVTSMADQHLRAEGDYKPFDTQLAKIAQHQGFDEPAQVVSGRQLDKAIQQGWIETWRGVRDSYDGGKTARDINNDLKHGPFEPGVGIYGNGTYVSVRRYTAESYRGAYPNYVTGAQAFEIKNLTGGAEGGLVRMAIDPAAKTIDYADLQEEMRYFATHEAPANMSANAWNVVNDPGRFAAMRGYDVIKVSGPSYNDGAGYPRDADQNADQYVILNRTVLMIQKEEPV